MTREKLLGALGESHTRVDAAGKVTGAAEYPGDIDRPGQLWLKTLYARRPHARIKRLDTARAERADGVVRVFTARDIPVNEFGLIMFDAPVLAHDVVRWIGEKVALVVAESEAQAAAALDLIDVEYEDLPAITDPHDARKPGVSDINPLHPGNLLKHIPIRKGDVARGFAESDVIVEGEYYTPMQEHAYLQPEAGIAYMDDEDRVTVQVAGQWTHEDRQQIAHALELPEERVRVIYPAIGGAFGGREDMSVQIILALAVWRLAQADIHRPVKTIWSREESILSHHKRHQTWIRARWGAKRDGTLVAAQVEVLADAGPYAYTSTKVLGNMAVGCAGPYHWPHAQIDAYAVATNNIPSGAFRGFGAPQAHFAAEQQMNKLAEALGIDPVALRLKNVLREGQLTTTQTPLPGGPVALPQVVARCAEAAAWEANRTRPPRSGPVVRGRGFACAFKNIGFSFGVQEGASATVEIHGTNEITGATLSIAAADCGQGSHTALTQMCAELLGIDVAQVSLVASDTATSESFGSASASRSTFMASNAIRGAVQQALQAWTEEERPARATYRYDAPYTENFDPLTGKAKPNIAYGYVAQAADVDVDTETGQVHVRRVWCADDVGRAVNPQLIEGQIEGAITQAVGFAVTENFVTRDGRVLTPHFSTYLIPGVLDAPERVDSVILEYPDDEGAWGVRGMAEMPFIPLAPAVTAAVHDATGIWFDALPLAPWRVWERQRTRNGQTDTRHRT
ncbi:MAG: xanthine dehydrogenase family protein [Chloroflexi bacterium]|nr:xanthine dehydrogenase family protein [Chloroflexota bacterium]